MTVMHVIPDERTTWRVYESDSETPLSEHDTANEAELVAHAHAADRDADRVVVHDRYHRTHDAGPSLVGRSSAKRWARARQLTLVRERARRLARDAR
jgi:hypothetical protein